MIDSASHPLIRKFWFTAGFILSLAIALVLGTSIGEQDFQPILIGSFAGILLIISIIDPRIIVYLIVFAMLLSPELQTGGSALRPISYRAEDFLIPLALISVLAHRAINPTYKLRFEPLFKPIVFFIFTIVASTELAISDQLVNTGMARLYVLKNIEYFMIYFLALNTLRTKDDTDRMLLALFVTAIIIFAITTSQIGTTDRLGAPFEGEKPEPNTLGGYLIFIIALHAGVLLRYPSNRMRLLSAASIGALIIPLLFTLSRSSYIAMVGVGFMLCVLERRAAIGALISLIFITTILLAPDIVWDRVSSTAALVEGPFEKQLVLEGSAASKLNSWVWFKIGLSTRPVWGWGMTGAGLIDSQFPRVFAEGGIIGLFSFFILILSVALLCKNGIRSKDHKTKSLAVGFAAGFVGLLTHSLGANTFLIVRIMEPFWFVAGLLAFRLWMEKEEQNKEPELNERTC